MDNPSRYTAIQTPCADHGWGLEWCDSECVSWCGIHLFLKDDCEFCEAALSGRLP